MNWSTVDRTSTAVGLRGIYTAVLGRDGRTLILTGIGHDDLPMIEMPSLGRLFKNVNDLRAYTEWFDGQPAEAQASGG